MPPLRGGWGEGRPGLSLSAQEGTKPGAPQALQQAGASSAIRVSGRAMGGSRRTGTSRNDKHCPCCAFSVPPSSQRGL